MRPWGQLFDRGYLLDEDPGSVRTESVSAGPARTGLPAVGSWSVLLRWIALVWCPSPLRGWLAIWPGPVGNPGRTQTRIATEAARFEPTAASRRDKDRAILACHSSGDQMPGVSRTAASGSTREARQTARHRRRDWRQPPQP